MRSKLRVRALTTVFLILLALGALPERGAMPAPSDPVNSVVAEDVKARVAAEGRARVLVEVRLPTPFVPEGALAAAALLAQRANLTLGQSQVLARLQGRGYALLHRFSSVPYMALEVEADALAELTASPFNVQRVVEDTLHEPSLPQSVPLIEADQAWGQGFDGTGIAVAILDTGVQTTHPFFAGKVVSEACYSGGMFGQSSTLCPNGQTSQIGPGAGVNCSLSISSACFHGTHVAGIAAGNGASAGVGYSGVARGAQIVSIQVFSRFDNNAVQAWSSNIIAGLERVYALRNQYTFASVNLSLGNGAFSGNCDGDPLKASIDNLRSVGIATVVAAGNDGSTSQISSPACISTAVGVGSTEKNDVVSSFSNIAAFLSLLAPGGSILSAYPGNQFALASGTSMAAPHVTGAFAVIKQAAPGASVSTILSALQQTGVPITDTRPGGTVTKPRIRVGSALSVLGAGQSFTLTVAKAGTGSGTVTSGDGTVNCGSTCAKSVTSGTPVTLTATPAASSTFSSWSGCSSASGATCNVTVSAATTVTATFTPLAAGLGVGLGGSGTGTVTSNDGVINCPGTCSSLYPTGTVLTLTATAGSGSTFKQWGAACAPSGTNPSCGVTLNSAQSVTATFSKTFTDGSGPSSAISAGTVIKAVHVLELRTAIDNLRAARGMGGFNWTDPVLTVGSTPAKGIHVLDLRAALAPVCSAAPGKCVGYTDGTLPPGQIVIKAAHLNEQRANVRALE